MSEQSAPRSADAGADRSRLPSWAPAGDPLAMPQEDDPGGEGHMWSGTSAPADDAAATDEAFDASTHIPAQPTEPSPF